MFLLMLYLICIIVQLNHIFIIVVLFGATASGVGLSEKLQKIKNRAALCYCMPAMKTILISCSRHSAGENLVINSAGQITISVMMFQTLHGLTPEDLQSRFASRNDITSYRLSWNPANKLALPQPRTVI